MGSIAFILIGGIYLALQPEQTVSHETYLGGDLVAFSLFWWSLVALIVFSLFMVGLVILKGEATKEKI